MSIVVVGQSLKKNYTSISNSLIRDPGIDDSTFRLICWMTSHEEGYSVNFASIQNALGYGRDKLRKILKNAETHNYLVRRKIRTSGGLFDFEYHIFKETTDARAFRESLSQAQLSSDLFSVGGATRGVKTGGGRTGGGSTRGGESAPLLEKQYKENQIKEDPPTPTIPVQEGNEISFSNSLTQHEQLTPPIPELPALLLTKPESSLQTENLSSGANIPARSFDKNEQSNITPQQDPFLNRRQFIPAKGTYKSASSDPWMKSANMPNSEFAQWLYDKRYKHLPGKMISDAKAEIRNNFERASDLWLEFITEKTPKQLDVETSSSVGYYSNRSLDWHKATFCELLDLKEKVGKDNAIAHFSTRYDQQHAGATIHWLNWLKTNYPQMYAHLYQQAA